MEDREGEEEEETWSPGSCYMTAASEQRGEGRETCGEGEGGEREGWRDWSVDGKR